MKITIKTMSMAEKSYILLKLERNGYLVCYISPSTTIRVLHKIYFWQITLIMRVTLLTDSFQQ